VDWVILSDCADEGAAGRRIADSIKNNMNCFMAFFIGTFICIPLGMECMRREPMRIAYKYTYNIIRLIILPIFFLIYLAIM
jgi:ABC-type dipeptide/oligopeptide/nickel transport system permease component